MAFNSNFIAVSGFLNTTFGILVSDYISDVYNAQDQDDERVITVFFLIINLKKLMKFYPG